MGSEKGGDLPEILRKKVITFDMSEFRAGPRIGEAVKKIIDVIARNYRSEAIPLTQLDCFALRTRNDTQFK
jgi:hypothetical protein